MHKCEYQGNSKIQGWWKQGGEVENAWERIGDEQNHGKKKKDIVEILDAFQYKCDACTFIFI